MAKNRRDKTKKKATKDVTMVAADEPQRSAGEWFTGVGAAVLEATAGDEAMATDEAATLAKGTSWASIPAHAHLKVKGGAIAKKASARGQRTKAQKLRKIGKLEKALASNDRYVDKCAKSQKSKEAKIVLTSLY